MKIKILVFIGLLITGTSLFAQSYRWEAATSGGYTYKYVTNDPTKSRFYTLKNGLTVILSPNPAKPSIEYRMSVRAGSNTDPKNATGLAHYLEHLLFKGTDRFGTNNWVKEKPLLDRIDVLYEKYNKTTDLAQRKEVYKEIDWVSGEASNYSIANEYDKMIQSIGGNSSNAQTTYEATVYNEDFPSNVIDKFLAIQSERFRKPIFRIFHTELETVYEEKNGSLDNDYAKLFEATMQKLFPTHNYGQQTTLGSIEHLKNPSMVEIKNYYHRYYVPNNMACILAGDFNPDEMIKKVDKAFDYMTAKPVPLYKPALEKPLTQVQKIDVFGQNAEMVTLSYRGFAANTQQALLLSLCKSILSNGKAGLIDININKHQKTLDAGADYQKMKDYGVFNLMGQPKQGQALEDVAKLLLQQIELLKQGKFDDDLIKAIVNNEKLIFLQAFDNNSSRVEYLSNAFINTYGTNWDKDLGGIEAAAKIKKAQVIAFANAFFKENYVIGFKRIGENKNILKIEKPLITPISTNPNLTSSFVKNILAAEVAPVKPQFLNYKKDIDFGKLGIANVLAIKNKDNEIFRMSYRFSNGTNNYKLLQYAASYLTFLGTEKYTAEELSKQFYNIACSYSLNVGAETTTISISGLQENFDKAVALVQHIFGNVKADEKALADFKASVLKDRANAKLNKKIITSALTSYAQYGSSNPFNNVLTNDEVSNLNSSELLYYIHNLMNYEHLITYYGPEDVTVITAQLKPLHLLPKEFTPAAPAKEYTYSTQTENQVYFTSYDMVQSEILWQRNTGVFDKNDLARINLFNNYFDGGLGSIVYQTIRESKALAYHTYASYIKPNRADKQCNMIAYVGSQADKMNDAITAMNELLNDLPQNDKSFHGAKANLITNLESSRVTKDAIFAYYFADIRLGYDYDSRSDLYKDVKPLTFKDLKTFHQEKIAYKPYTYLIVGSDKIIKQEDIAKFGKVTMLSLEQLFGY